MPKEPSNPSLANARTEKHCSKIETNRFRNNNGQRTIRGIKHWYLIGYSSFQPRINFYLTGKESSLQTPTFSYRQALINKYFCPPIRTPKKQNSLLVREFDVVFVIQPGFEPGTYSLEDCCSIQTELLDQ